VIFEAIRAFSPYLLIHRAEAEHIDRSYIRDTNRASRNRLSRIHSPASLAFSISRDSFARRSRDLGDPDDRTSRSRVRETIMCRDNNLAFIRFIEASPTDLNAGSDLRLPSIPFPKYLSSGSRPPDPTLRDGGMIPANATALDNRRRRDPTCSGCSYFSYTSFAYYLYKQQCICMQRRIRRRGGRCNWIIRRAERIERL